MHLINHGIKLSLQLKLCSTWIITETKGWESEAYGLLEAAEVDGEGALVVAGAERLYRDVGDRGNHHKRREVEEKSAHK